MSSISSFSDVVGRRVVSSTDATEVGEVKSFVLDRNASRIRRVHVDGRARSAQFIDWNDVESVGSDAVMVRSAESVHDAMSDNDTAFVKGEIEAIGAIVLDTAGYQRGQVTDVHFEDGSGDVNAVMTTEGRVPAERVRSVGSYALIIDVAE